jgi:pimeloyl-ACP methyl ester carboxylesterase
MRTGLITIATPTVPLDGVFYQAEQARGAIQLFHGATMNFYFGPPRFLPPILTQSGWDCLAYNRRGHDLLSTRDSRDVEGGAHQTAAESLEDDELARAWLVEKTGRVPVAVGHSHGGMLAAAHVATHSDTPGLVLLSAHHGGKGIMKLMTDVGMMAADHLEELTAEARSMVAAGRGKELLRVPGWWYILSADSFVDYLENTPDILEAAPRITCPVLYVVGETEPEARYPMSAFAERCAGPVTTVRLEGCGHFYTGFEEHVAGIISDWLEETQLRGAAG